MILSDSIQKALLLQPVYTPTLIGASDERITALLLRVDSLQTFKPKGLRFQVSFVGYEKDGTHLACVAFRVFDNPSDPLEGRKIDLVAGKEPGCRSRRFRAISELGIADRIFRSKLSAR